MSLRDWTILRHLDSSLLKKVRLAFVFGDSGSEAFVITRENEVYAVGKNFSGCLGFGMELNSYYRVLDCAEKNSVLSEMDIKSFAAACNSNTSSGWGSSISIAVVTNDGKVYDWGTTSTGNRQNNQSKLFSPYPVIILDKVKEVACGTSHFLALSENGKVYSWGFNEKGQLGLGTDQSAYCSNGVAKYSHIVEVTGQIRGKFVVEIGCGSCFSLALIDDGTIFGWGCCVFGQLGFTNQTQPSYSMRSGRKIVDDPVLIPFSTATAIKIRRIACGPAHVLALDRNGELYGWGKNDSYQLGPSCVNYTFSTNSSSKYIVCARPFKINLPHRVADIGASYLHELSVAATETNVIMFWGLMSIIDKRFAPTVSNYESIDEAFAYLTHSMHKPLIISETKRMTLQESLKNEIGNAETFDVVLQTESNEPIRVHKSILKMRSNFFKAKIQEESPRKIVKIDMKKYSAPLLNAYMQYIYTDELQVDVDVAIQLFKMAAEFDDNNLKILCERHIKRLMTPEKVAECYTVSRKLAGAEDINKFCLEFAVRHAREVMESPGYKNWDLETLQMFVPEFVKSRGY